jgi:hypothetical protein
VNNKSPANNLEMLERQGWEALSGTSGAAFYEDVMADDGLMVFPGLVMDKRASIDVIGKASPWLSYELSDVRIATVGDVGLVTYRAVGQRLGQPPYEAVMSSVYVRRGTQWQLLLHQQSPGSQGRA